MAKETRHVRVNVSTNAAKSMNKGTAAATGLGGALKGVGASAAAATGGIRAMTMALISSGVGAIVVAIGALVAGFISVTRKSMEFATAMSDLKAVLGTGGTQDVMNALSADAKRLGATTAFTATQVAQLQTEFAKLGFTADEILNVTEATLSLAAAAGVDLPEAATVAGSTLRAFGLDSSETQRVVDVMAKSFSTSSLDMEKFRESMKLVAPIAKTVQVPIEDASAALAVLANNGVHGSMAGTQLKRIMSDLAQKTGKDFNTSLEMMSTKLAAATSDAEKLAIAKEYVGDRAKGALITLAENTDQLEDLTKQYEDAKGAADAMAETKLDNLQGDMTKLGSAWEGLMLQIEDGDGVFSMIARGGIQVLTMAITNITRGLQLTGANFRHIKTVIPKYWDVIVNSFQRAGGYIRLIMAKIGKAVADTPLLGWAFDSNAAARNLRAAQENMDKLTDEYMRLNQDIAAVNKAHLKTVQDIASGAYAERKMQEATEAKEAQAFREAQEKEAIEAEEERIKNRKTFLEKLHKMEEDLEDTNEIDKINRKRQRHLEEMRRIANNAHERRRLEKRINDYYDALVDKQREKDINRFIEAIEDVPTPLDKLDRDMLKKMKQIKESGWSVQQQLEAQLALNLWYERESTKIIEDATKAKEEAKKRVMDKYQYLTPEQKLAKEYDEAVAEIEQAVLLEEEKQRLLADVKRKYDEDLQAIEDKKVKDAKDREQKIIDNRIKAMNQTLDAAIQFAGEDSKLGKRLLQLKLAYQAAELAGAIAVEVQKLVAKGQTAAAEGAIDGAKAGTAIAAGAAESAKVGFPANLITLSAYAVQAAGIWAAFKKSKQTLDQTAGATGGNSGINSNPMGAFNAGSAGSPSFNVLGQTSAGENMLANVIEGANSQPVRAYVVEGEMTSAQQLARNAAISASFG